MYGTMYRASMRPILTLGIKQFIIGMDCISDVIVLISVVMCMFVCDGCLGEQPVI